MARVSARERNTGCAGVFTEVDEEHGNITLVYSVFEPVSDEEREAQGV
jgi:hypothetical protein